MTAKMETSWHDNLIYALHIEAPDPDRNLWHSNLILDIDHIVEWVRGDDGGVRFLVAPATLTFHDVTNLKLDVDFTSELSQSLNELSIASITRVEELKRPNYEYYTWLIELNLPPRGTISFGASGYTQTFRAEPILCDEQSIPAAQRSNLMKAS